jgi:argininosuccinate lyase
MAKKLWEKNIDVNPEIERFTVGKDRELDLMLAPYDVLGSLAHSTMLESIGMLTAEEMQELHGELRRIKGNAVSGDAEITLADRQPSDVKANTVTGDCEVNCQPGPDPAVIQLTSVSGDITIR